MAVPQLQLSVRTISERGVNDTGENAVAPAAAATTVDIGLRAGDGQFAHIDATGGGSAG